MLVDVAQQLQLLGHVVARLQLVQCGQIQQHALAQPIGVAQLDGALKEADGLFQVARVEAAHAQIVEQLRIDGD